MKVLRGIGLVLLYVLVVSLLIATMPIWIWWVLWQGAIA